MLQAFRAIIDSLIHAGFRLNTVGLSYLNPHICEGDWAKANENRKKWLFERTHQIGTGDSFCDPTYLRKK
jgi:hypothetical protein